MTGSCVQVSTLAHPTLASCDCIDGGHCALRKAGGSWTTTRSMQSCTGGDDPFVLEALLQSAQVGVKNQSFSSCVTQHIVLNAVCLQRTRLELRATLVVLKAFFSGSLLSRRGRPSGALKKSQIDFNERQACFVGLWVFHTPFQLSSLPLFFQPRQILSYKDWGFSSFQSRFLSALLLNISLYLQYLC